MKKENLLKTKKITTSFAVIALFGGFLFLNPSMTGNVVSESSSYSVNILSIIGLLLIGCAVVLALYSIKKK